MIAGVLGIAPRVQQMIHARAARWLETGALTSRPTLALASIWERRARVSRPVVLPRGVAVIGVGGSTLGGSYKTPLVLALARALAERGERVAVVAHGYGGSGPRGSGARRIAAGDAVKIVGDDALWLARELGPLGVPVVLGGSRDDALRVAASLAPLLIIDGLLQTMPERLALSVLALSAMRPWGAGTCPPAGDLRAARTSLLAATDVVARVGTTYDPSDLGDAAFVSELHGTRPLFDVTATLEDARTRSGESVSLSSLAGARVGVVLAVARPERVLTALLAAGVSPVETRLFGDHAVPRAHRPKASVDVWLTTPKCATKMGSVYEGAPVLALVLRLTLPFEFLGLVARCRKL